MSPIPIGILAVSGAGEAGYLAQVFFNNSTRRPLMGAGINGNGDWVVSFRDDSSSTTHGFVKVNAAGNAILLAKINPWAGGSYGFGGAPLPGSNDDFIYNHAGYTERISSTGDGTITWPMLGMAPASGGGAVFGSKPVNSGVQRHLRYLISSQTSSFNRQTSFGSSFASIFTMQANLNAFVSLMFDSSAAQLAAVRYTSAGTLSWGRRLDSAFSIGGTFPVSTGGSDQAIFLLRGTPTLTIGALNSSGNPAWQVGVNRGTGQAFSTTDRTTGITYVVDYASDGSDRYIFVVGINSSGTVVNHFEIVHNSTASMLPRFIALRNGLLHISLYDDGQRNVTTLMKVDPAFRGTVNINSRSFTFRAPVYTSTSAPAAGTWNSTTFSSTTVTNVTDGFAGYTRSNESNVSITNVPA